MKIALSVAAVLAAAGAAQAAFQAAAIDFGSAEGTPITASADFVQSAIFQSPANDTPAAANITGSIYGSAVFMSGIGISGPDGSAIAVNSADLTTNNPIDGNTLQGGWLVAPDDEANGFGFEPSGANGLFGDADGFGSVQVARLSVPAGETVNFDGVMGSVTVTPDGFGSNNETFLAEVNGAAVSAAGSQFELISVSRGTNELDGAMVDTYDVFINELPTPGTVTLAGLAGLAGLRRRR